MFPGKQFRAQLNDNGSVTAFTGPLRHEVHYPDGSVWRADWAGQRSIQFKNGRVWEGKVDTDGKPADRGLLHYPSGHVWMGKLDHNNWMPLVIKPLTPPAQPTAADQDTIARRYTELQGTGWLHQTTLARWTGGILGSTKLLGLINWPSDLPDKYKVSPFH